MFFYSSNGFGICIQFETMRGSLVFLTGSYDHALSFFQGVNTLACFYTSQTLSFFQGVNTLACFYTSQTLR